ncbi:MAG: 50S ribosomal protein L5 [Candidatus Micrarchaeia archaeon]
MKANTEQPKVKETEPLMRKIRLAKITINTGNGSDERQQELAAKLLNYITNRKVLNALSRKRIPAFGISTNQKIGAYVSVRGEEAKFLAKRLFAAVDYRIKRSSVIGNSVNFGIKEYIDIAGIKYNPEIGMLGMNVNLSFVRPGFRVALKKRGASKIPKKHKQISYEEIADYLKKEFNVIIE